MITHDCLKRLLSSHPEVRRQILAIAAQLEAIEEYGGEQALFVAADVFLNRFAKALSASAADRVQRELAATYVAAGAGERSR